MIVVRTVQVTPVVTALWLALAGTAVAATSEAKPVVSPGKPAAAQGKPVAPQAKPGVPQGKPAVLQGKPAVPQGKPVASDGKPLMPKGKQATPPKITQPMQVVIVRDSRPGCEPDCAEWISAEGQIVAATTAQFRRVFKVLGKKKLPIFIHSTGGNVDAAFAIGRDIRKRGLDVAVERTLFEKCEAASVACDRRTLKDGDKGRPEPVAAHCVSSCVFILAAGTERLAPVYGFVGVHQLTAFQTVRLMQRQFQVKRKFENWRFVVTRELISEEQVSSSTYEREPGYASTRAYFTEMGIDTAKILPLLLGTPHDDVHRMTPEERRTTRVVTRVAAGHSLLPSAATTGAATAGVASGGAATSGAASSGAASGPTEAAASAAPTVPAVPAALATAGTPAAGAPGSATTTPLPAAAKNTLGLYDVSASVLVLHPPPKDVIELYFRLKSMSGAPVRPAQYTADIYLSNGKKLTAGSTGDDMIDPLHATLARDDYCALHRAGDLSLKVALTNSSLPAWPRRMQFDLAKVNGEAEFAAKHCGKKEEAVKPVPRS